MTAVAAETRVTSSTTLDGWQCQRLGDICLTTSGGTPSRKNPDYFRGAIPWVKSGELPDGPVYEIEESISEEAIADSSAKLFPRGTLLIALYGATVGKLGILSRPAATNQAVCAIFPPAFLDTKFLFWYLKARRGDLVARAVGGAQPNISQAVIRSLVVPVPPLDEQRSVVAEIEKQFSRLDKAVANFKRVRANIRRYKAAVIEEAANGTTARDLPVIELMSDAFKTGISIKKSESGGVPSLKLSALRDGRIDFTQSKLLPVRVDEVRQLLLRRGDFLVTRGNGSIKLVGAGALVEIVPWPVIYPDLLIRVRMRADTIEPRWLNLVWRTKYVRMQIERKAKTTAGIYKISQRDLGSIKLPAPSLEEQKRISAEVERRLSVVEDLETQMSLESMRAARLRESVLAHAFTSTRSSSFGGQSEEFRS